MVTGMPPEKPDSDASMMSMNTMPEAPSRAVWGKSTHCRMPEMSAVSRMLEQGPRAIFFFHRRADDQQQEHIVQEMIPAGMAQHMAEEPDVKQRVFQRTAIDAEQVLCGPAACPLPQEQSPQGKQKKGQDHRRIVLQLQC